MAVEEMDLAVESLTRAYNQGLATPVQVCLSLRGRSLEDDNACYISMTPIDDLQARCQYLEAVPREERSKFPLWGIPFAVKDNIDVQGFVTTAACPQFSEREASGSAPCVQALLNAGAVMLGKTNMDQFAAGLVGTRSPYGTAKNAFDERFIPGGSSSGSGALVGKNLISFALGTDTAGSGRVPAMLNGCVGIKPTVGKVSTMGVIPACKSLDCVSCFARNVEDGALVIRIMEEACSPKDSTKREDPSKSPQEPRPKAEEPNSNQNSPALNGHAHQKGFRFGIPSSQYLEFEGPGGSKLAELYRSAFQRAIERMNSLGGIATELDFKPFCTIAEMLYNSAFVSERYAGIQSFIETPRGSQTSVESIQNDERMERVTREIISKGKNYTAYDLFRAFEQLSELKIQAFEEMSQVDVLLVPTVLQHYLVAEIEAEEKRKEPPTWSKNALNGRFTNFVNLLDMAAISVPSEIVQHPTLHLQSEGDEAERLRHEILTARDGTTNPILPIGITIIGRAWSDEWLWDLAEKMHTLSGLGCGPSKSRSNAVK